MSRAGSLMTRRPNQFVLERLEYGKFCASKDGPIEPHAEHGILAFSAGFPSELRESCTPRQLGLGEAAEQPALIANANHGTVLRAVMTKPHCNVCYRIGTRPEGGKEDPQSRHYVVGQYRADTTGEASPAEFVKSLSEPRGFTREMAQALEPVTIQSEPPRLCDMEHDPFLQNAVMYALSGIGISIEADEAEFFRLVDALWHALPRTVQALFSAGWNVGPALANVLVASYSTKPIRERLLYDAERGKWSPAENLSEADLFPGRMFLFRRFEAGRPPERSDAPIEDPGSLPFFPDLSDSSTRSAMRREGLLDRDEYVRARVEGWLEGGDPADIPAEQLANFVRTLLAGPQRERFLDWAGGAVDKNAGCPVKQQQLIWAILSGDCTAVLLPRSALGKSTVEWLRSVLAKDSAAALRVFCDAHDLDERLNAEAAAAWDEVLSASLDEPACTGYHESLIRARRNGYYATWVARNATSLAIDLAERSTAGVLRDTYQLEADAALTIEHLLAVEPPTQGDECWVSRLCTTNGRRLARLVERLWRVRNPVLLAWAEKLPPESFDDAFLRIAAHGSVEVSALMACAEQVQGFDPGCRFMNRLASEALRQVDRLREIIEDQPDKWRDVMELWPAEVRMTVVDSSPAMSSKVFGGAWSPSREELRERIEFWFRVNGKSSAANRARARVILRAAAEMTASRSEALSAVEICGALERGELIQGTPVEASEPILAAQVMKAAGVSLSKAAAEKVWARADEGWQLRLLLDVCGFLDEFAPTTVQLTRLIAHRRWLRERLADDVSQEARRRFAVSTHGFHEANYADGSIAWDYTYKDAPLWAAFQKLPREYRGPLAPALEAYAASTREMAPCCLLHLDLYGDDLAYDEVLNAFLLPRLREALTGGAEELTEALRAMARGAGNSKIGRGLGWALFRKHAAIELEPAFDTDKRVFESCDAGRKIRVAEPAFPLFWRMLRHPLLARALTRIQETGAHG